MQDSPHNNHPNVQSAGMRNPLYSGGHVPALAVHAFYLEDPNKSEKTGEVMSVIQEDKAGQGVRVPDGSFYRQDGRRRPLQGFLRWSRGSEGRTPGDNSRRNSHGEGNSKCKGPEAGMGGACLRNRKKPARHKTENSDDVLS